MHNQKFYDDINQRIDSGEVFPYLLALDNVIKSVDSQRAATGGKLNNKVFKPLTRKKNVESIERRRIELKRV